MTTSLELTNGDAWVNDVGRAYLRLELDSEADLAELAGIMSSEMRAHAPVMDADERVKRLSTGYGRTHTRKRTGRTTIRFFRGRDERGFYIDVGPGKGAFYLAFYEFGTRFQRARPFLRPAIERAIAEWAAAGSRH